MCRLSAYKGKPILIGDIVIKPENSLLFQSRDAAYHPGVIDKTNRRNILVNGDGFGVAWYGEDTLKGSCCFKFVTPAWSNQNLRNIGEHVSSHLIFAHIRAASSGHDPHENINVSHENCHPFKFGNFTFMHNGGVPHFSRVKLSLLKLLSERIFQEIKGSTDSEHLFALFLEFLPVDRVISVEDMINALNLTISSVIYLCQSLGFNEPCSFNICVTDGINIIATRFRNGPDQPPSLYYNYGSDFKCDENGNFYSNGSQASEIIISSAPLSRVNCDAKKCSYLRCGQKIVDEVPGCWSLMPKNHMLVCRGNASNPHVVDSIQFLAVESSSAISKTFVDTKLYRNIVDFNSFNTGNNIVSSGKRSRSGSGSFGCNVSTPSPKVFMKNILSLIDTNCNNISKTADINPEDNLNSKRICSIESKERASPINSSEDHKSVDAIVNDANLSLAVASTNEANTDNGCNINNINYDDIMFDVDDCNSTSIPTATTVVETLGYMQLSQIKLPSSLLPRTSSSIVSQQNNKLRPKLRQYLMKSCNKTKNQVVQSSQYFRKAKIIKFSPKK
eukprot:gene5439-7532_t